MTGSAAMDAEFDTVASWTADAALALGPDHYVPAGCRGSGGPRTFDALLDRLEVSAGDRLLDVGAGVGGPDGYARHARGLQPTLVEPEHGACVAARRLFGLPVVQADALTLPFATGSFDLAWSLGVLCTTDDHARAARELRRVLSDRGRAGLLVYVAQHELPEQPEGNNFPTEAGLRDVLAQAGLHVTAEWEMDPPDREAASWQQRSRDVDAELAAHHGADAAWREAQEQSAAMGRLLHGRHVVARVLVVGG